MNNINYINQINFNDLLPNNSDILNVDIKKIGSNLFIKFMYMPNTPSNSTHFSNDGLKTEIINLETISNEQQLITLFAINLYCLENLPKITFHKEGLISDETQKIIQPILPNKKLEEIARKTELIEIKKLVLYAYLKTTLTKNLNTLKKNLNSTPPQTTALINLVSIINETFDNGFFNLIPKFLSSLKELDSCYSPIYLTILSKAYEKLKENTTNKSQLIDLIIEIFSEKCIPENFQEWGNLIINSGNFIKNNKEDIDKCGTIVKTLANFFKKPVRKKSITSVISKTQKNCKKPNIQKSQKQKNNSQSKVEKSSEKPKYKIEKPEDVFLKNPDFMKKVKNHAIQIFNFKQTLKPKNPLNMQKNDSNDSGNVIIEDNSPAEDDHTNFDLLEDSK